MTAEFGLTASSLGFLTSAYLLGFAGMQIPAGLLIDRFGPRRVQAGLLLIAATGAVVFAMSTSVASLTIGRALIGAGVGASLMVSFSVFVVWLPPARVPTASGLLMAFGGLGAFVAGAPTESFVSAGGDWRHLFIALAVLTVMVSAAIFLVVPDRDAHGGASFRDLLAGLRRIYADRVFWAVAPLSIASCGAAFALQGLWAGPWLMQVAQLDSAAVGVHLSVMAIALLAGSLACGPLAALTERFGFSLLQAVAGLALLFIAAMTGLVLQLTAASLLLWAMIGFLSNPMALTYLAISRRFPSSMAGRVNTGMNALVLTGSFLIQWLIGSVLDLWAPIAPGIYPPVAFQVSFGLILFCIVASWIWYVLSIRSYESQA